MGPTAAEGKRKKRKRRGPGRPPDEGERREGWVGIREHVDVLKRIDREAELLGESRTTFYRTAGRERAERLREARLSAQPSSKAKHR